MPRELPPPPPQTSLQRRASSTLHAFDKAIQEKDRAAGDGVLSAVIDAELDESKGGEKVGGLRRALSQRTKSVLDREPSTPTTLLRSRSVKTIPSQAQGLSEHAPPVVLTDDAPQQGAPLPRHLKMLVAPLAGMMAGALEITTLWPFEWAKVQQQLNRSDPKYSALADARRLGLGVYRGLPSMLVGVPMQGAVRFTTLDHVKAALTEPGKTAGPATNLAAGLLAGTLEATLVVTPVETVKTRLVDANKGLLRGIYDFVQAEGPSGIYRGLLPTICKSASNQALRFVIFGEYKRFVWGGRPSKDMPPLLALGGGMTAGAIGSVITMPFDTIKTRMQGLEAARYSSTLNCITTVVRAEGVRALFKGLSMRLARAVPGQGIIFASYEFFSNGVTQALTPRKKSFVA